MPLSENKYSISTLPEQHLDVRSNANLERLVCRRTVNVDREASSILDPILRCAPPLSPLIRWFNPGLTVSAAWGRGMCGRRLSLFRPSQRIGPPRLGARERNRP